MLQSQLFTKTLKEAPKDEVSLNAQLLIRGSFVSKLMAGVYTYLPLGLRVLNKIENIIREEMNAVGGQEILLPALHPKANWQTTDRWDNFDALFKIKETLNKEYALAPTHEEVVTPLLANFVFSYKDLPRAVYQIQTKFRNEPRAKSGLLRGREFRMKDLYSFHSDEKDLNDYYEKVKKAYGKIFERVGLGERTYLTLASGGAFSKYSEEFQTVTDAGEDIIYLCAACRVAVNREIFREQEICPNCGNKNLAEKKGIEVGNIFKLGTRFSAPFKFNYLDETGAKKPIIMGTYGLGSSRLMGALVEVYHDANGIIWPASVAPYQVHLLALGEGEAVVKAANLVYNKLSKEGREVLFDDRLVSAGIKLKDSDLLGLPLRYVVSEKTLAKNSIEVRIRSSGETKLEAINN